jgi:hypothetical protein
MLNGNAPYFLRFLHPVQNSFAAGVKALLTALPEIYPRPRRLKVCKSLPLIGTRLLTNGNVLHTSSL